MKSFACILALALTGALPVAAEIIGVRDIEFSAPARGIEIGATVWYPAAAGGKPDLVGDNGVFLAAEANRNAPIMAGNYPVIVLLRGGFRSAPNSDSWIAARLAEDG